MTTLIKIKHLFNAKHWYKDLYGKVFVVRQENKEQYGVYYKRKIEGIFKHHCEVLEVSDIKINIDKTLPE